MNENEPMRDCHTCGNRYPVEMERCPHCRAFFTDLFLIAAIGISGLLAYLYLK